MKLYDIGTISSAKKNIPIILIAATNPNSCKILLLVKINVAKPEAVVKFVSKMALPMLTITI